MFQKTSPLNQLPEEGSFLIRLASLNPYDKRDRILRGSKRNVIRGMFDLRHDLLNFKIAYILPNEIELSNILKEKSWTKIENNGEMKFIVFQKIINNKKYHLDFSEGLIYISIKDLIENDSQYLQVTYDDIKKYDFIDFDLKLEEIKL